MELIFMARSAGVLLSITSLPSPYGIGTIGKEARKFADFLKKSGQTIWQILPVGPTSYGDSPYQSFSTFAGNPYFIDLETLIEDELLTKEECDQADFGENEEEIDGKISLIYKLDNGLVACKLVSFKHMIPHHEQSSHAA